MRSVNPESHLVSKKKNRRNGISAFAEMTADFFRANVYRLQRALHAMAADEGAILWKLKKPFPANRKGLFKMLSAELTRIS